MDELIPLQLEVRDRLDTLTSLVANPTGITWYLRRGAVTDHTAAEAVSLMSDDQLSALLIMCGRGHISTELARRDLQAAIGPLGGLVVTPELIAKFRHPRA